MYKPQSTNPGIEHNCSSLDWIYKYHGKKTTMPKSHTKNHAKNDG